MSARLWFAAAVVSVTVACGRYGARINTPAPEALLEHHRTAPIVLMHGMGGFALGAGESYFVGVAERLRNEGYVAFTTEVSPLDTVERRAAQAAEQIEAFMRESTAERVHIIGHSQGGLDARYLVSRLGFADRVVSVTTISTPHRGSMLADAYLGRLSDAGPVLSSAIGAIVGTLTGTHAALQEQLEELSVLQMTTAFNPGVPNVEGVLYYSYAGRTDRGTLLWDAITHLSGWALLASFLAVQHLEGPNDGLVSIQSAKWGVFLGTIPASHLDQIGRPFAIVPPGFDHLAFFSALAAFVHERGPAPLQGGIDQKPIAKPDAKPVARKKTTRRIE